MTCILPPSASLPARCRCPLAMSLANLVATARGLVAAGVGAAIPPAAAIQVGTCLLYTSPSPRDGLLSIRRQRQMCIRDSPLAMSLANLVATARGLVAAGVGAAIPPAAAIQVG